jgi:hypothetical protein
MTKRDKIITEFFYTTNSVRINEKLAGQLEKTLQSFPVNDSVYSIVIPPHSILLLDKTHNFVSQKFTSVIINNRELIEDRFMYTAEGSIKEKEGLTFVSYYDIY